MAKETEKQPQEDKKKLVLCPECGAEVDLEKDDECPKCDLNVARVYEQRRYRKALRQFEESYEAEENPKGKKKKAADWNPFA